MGLIQEKEIRAYQTKNNTLACPGCATDEEKAADTKNVVTEDTIHDVDPVFCCRCNKKLK